MYYWIVIVFIIATMLGLNLSKKDDYRDAVLMPKIEPVISRAVTQHTAAYKYFQASFVANSNNTQNGEADGSPWPELLSKGIAPQKDEHGNVVTEKNEAGEDVPVLKSMVIKHIKGGAFTTDKLGKAQLANFAPYGFDFDARDPDYDPVTRFVCVDRETGAPAPTGCDTLVLNRVVDGKASGAFDPDGKFASVGYLVTYMPIPSMWDTPYYHNMIVNSIKRISDNTLRFGIVKPLITSGGSIVSVNSDNVLKYTGRGYAVTNSNLGNIYTVGVPDGSSRAIYTVLDEYAVTGRLKDEGLTSSNLIGVFTFIPGQIASYAATDFPSRACTKGTATDKRDVNGMLMFIHRITPMENETVELDSTGKVKDPQKLLIGSVNTYFCDYTNTNKDDDAFYDETNIFSNNKANPDKVN